MTTPTHKNLNLFCHHCGAPLLSNARFCTQCGTPVLAEQSATASSSPKAASSISKSTSVPEKTVTRIESKPPPLPKATPTLESNEKEISRPGDRGAACLGFIVLGVVVAAIAPIPVGAKAVLILFYLSITFGISKKSRIAAVIGLIVGCAYMVLSIVALGSASPAAAGAAAPAILVTGLWLKFLYLSMRGTFAYHRYLATGLTK